MLNYKIEISNFKDKPPVMTTWQNVCKVFDLDYTPTPTTPELIAVKKGLSKRFGITLDDKIRDNDLTLNYLEIKKCILT